MNEKQEKKLEIEKQKIRNRGTYFKKKSEESDPTLLKKITTS